MFAPLPVADSPCCNPDGALINCRVRGPQDENSFCSDRRDGGRRVRAFWLRRRQTGCAAVRATRVRALCCRLSELHGSQPDEYLRERAAHHGSQQESPVRLDEAAMTSESRLVSERMRWQRRNSVVYAKIISVTVSERRRPEPDQTPGSTLFHQLIAKSDKSN